MGRGKKKKKKKKKTTCRLSQQNHLSAFTKKAHADLDKKTPAGCHIFFCKVIKFFLSFIFIYKKSHAFFCKKTPLFFYCRESSKKACAKKSRASFFIFSFCFPFVFLLFLFVCFVRACALAGGKKNHNLLLCIFLVFPYICVFVLFCLCFFWRLHI